VPAAEVLARLDAWLGRPLFSETARPWLGSTEFPDVHGRGPAPSSGG
jgi:hypothetical protein